MKEERVPFRAYRELEYGEQVTVFGDPAEGGDYCAAVACSKKHYDFPLVFNERMDSAQFGYEINSFCKYIFNQTKMWPKLAIERNTGQATIYVLKQLNYPDLFRMVDFAATNSQEKGDIGWVTTGSWSGGELIGTRRKMFDDFGLALKQGILKLYDEDQIRQIMNMRRIHGGGRAPAAKKDDIAIATFGSWQVHLITPTQYLDDFNVEEFKKEQQKWRIGR